MIDKVEKAKYCFDTDTLVSSWRLHYKIDVFSELWDRIGAMVKEGVILVPEEVSNEIGKGNDGLVDWLKRYSAHIIPISAEQIEIVKEIVNKYPLASQYKKPRPYHADPFVVALGKIKRCTVVSYEKPRGNKDNPSVADLCKEYGVHCCTMPDLFQKEEWKFNIG